MNVLVLQHASFEGIGNLAGPLARLGCTVRYARLFERATLPPLEGSDLVMAMGGPMSVNDEASFAWLAAEKSFLRQAMEADVRLLGVCLGAQLIASALGARVYRNPVKEIGWFAVNGVQGDVDAFRFPPQFPAFHWHGETFDLPSGAVRLARTRACDNQAFQIGRRVIGLQFHLEATPENVEAMIEHGGEELQQGGPYVQSGGELRAPSATAYVEIEHLMGQVLAYLTETVQNGAGSNGAGR